ncbi:crossover junction endodeoxyribonuclease RuvC [Thermosediminibacter oceani DSM 16646]|uniref:Crossover junction endodeoxyribonuclease RuvC n=2 Tax=Thermosediminibacter TaxID=291988 RepID=D9RXR3_THEOJ|nr:crossover junction endodeoxyribonuclease RuvC [Thermosediminibacter oceani DSM 16646]
MCRNRQSGDFMIIMGIDPGIAISGYGVVCCNGTEFEVLDFGVLKTESSLSVPERLKAIYEGYLNLIENYKPAAIAVEELFFNKNAKTAIAVGQARGVALLAAASRNVKVYEYTPLQVKQAVVGYGRAEKMQVQEMVRVLLNLKTIPKPDDAADALAVALCHINSLNLQRYITTECRF